MHGWKWQSEKACRNIFINIKNGDQSKKYRNRKYYGYQNMGSQYWVRPWQTHFRAQKSLCTPPRSLKLKIIATQCITDTMGSQYQNNWCQLGNNTLHFTEIQKMTLMTLPYDAAGRPTHRLLYDDSLCDSPTKALQRSTNHLKMIITQCDTDTKTCRCSFKTT
jgi:hypothetical protein